MTRAALAGISAFALAYLLAGTLQLPVLVYDPLARVASVSRTVSGVSNDPKLLPVVGVPATIENVMPMPRAQVMERIIEALSKA